MAQKRLVAPDTPITSYPTPEVANIVITLDVDSRLPGYKVLEYGTLYPDQTRYPGAKLVAQTPLEDDRFVRRVFATDRVNQDTYNYAIRFSAGEPDYPIYVRTYVEPRDTYVPLADNSPDPVIPGAFLVDEEASPAEGELNNLYLTVTRIYETLPGPWVPSSRYDDDLGLVQIRRRSVVNSGQVASLTENTRTTYEARDGSTGVYTELEESWSTELDGNGNSQFPVKDRDFYDASRGPIQERRQLVSTTGTEVASLSNNNGVITQISYEAYNEFLSVKIVQTYSVNGPQLTGFVTDNEGQLATVTTQRKGSDNYVAPQPTATKTVEVDREDAESVVERVIDVPGVFAAEIYRKTKEDLTPAKFKARVLESTTEQNTAGTAASNFTLDTNEFVKTEQQVTKFVKRTSTTSRTTPTTTSFVEQVLTNQGQLGTRTITLSSGAQVITPLSALIVDSNVEELGDGRTVKTTITVPGVFDSLTKSVQRPDVIPEKFRSNIGIVRTEQILEENTVVTPILKTGEYLKTVQRLTEFTVQDTTVSREETYNSLSGSRLEENFGLQLPYTEYISTSIPAGASTEGEGLGEGVSLVRTYSTTDLDTVLGSFSAQIPTSIDLDLPPVLKNINVTWKKEKSTSSDARDTTGGEGTFLNITQQDSGTVSSTISLIPTVDIELENIWGKNLPATVHLFFLKKEELTKAKIVSKTGASADWPILKPKSFTTTIYGKSERKSLQASIQRSLTLHETGVGYGYLPSNGTSEESSASLIPVSVNVPLCLTEGKSINISDFADNKDLEIALTYEALGGTSPTGFAFNFAKVEIKPKLTHRLDASAIFTVPATSPDKLPDTGIYVISSSSEPYKFGWYFVRAVTFDAANLK
jgi:hypothetical protein